MPRKGPKLIEDHLIPALNDGTYGDYLQWVNPAEGIFRVRWFHKNSTRWTVDDCVVFTDWDVLKGRTAFDGEYFYHSKQRFRAALAKLDVKQIGKDTNGYKTFKLNRKQLRTAAVGIENVRPDKNKKSGKTEQKNTESANVDCNDGRILVPLNANSGAAETYVPKRPVFVKLKKEDVEEVQQEPVREQVTECTQKVEEQLSEESKQKEYAFSPRKNAIIENRKSILEGDYKQPGGPASSLDILTEALSVYVASIRNDSKPLEEVQREPAQEQPKGHTQKKERLIQEVPEPMPKEDEFCPITDEQNDVIEWSYKQHSGLADSITVLTGAPYMFVVPTWNDI